MFWWCSLGGFVAGVIAARSTKDGVGRSVLKSIIRAGYAAGQSVRTAVAEAREEVGDIAAEAKYEAENPMPPTV